MKTEDFDVDALFLAVAGARDYMVSIGDKPSAEKWTANSEHRLRMFEWVKGRYCEITGCKQWNFPFSVDGVVLAFLRIRKEGRSNPGEDAEYALFNQEKKDAS